MVVDVGATAQTATYGGGASAMFFGLTANETAAVVGAVVAVLGFAVQCLYTLDKRSRAVVLHKLEVERLKNDSSSDGGRTPQDTEDTA